MTEPTKPRRKATVPPAPEAPAVEPDVTTVSPLSSVGLPVTGDMLELPDGRVMAIAEFHTRLAALSAPFSPDRIERLPKAIAKAPQGQSPSYFTCRADDPERDRASADGIYCGGRHPRSIHLDYVGHAGITERLVSVDPLWSYEWQHADVVGWAKVAVDRALEAGDFDRAQELVSRYGAPLQRDGGVWINLYVLGIRVPGFGDAAGKSGPNATKEIVGDAIRNAAMRAGVGTYLWSKSDHALALRGGGEEVDPEALERAAAERAEERSRRSRRAASSRPATPAAAPTAPAEVDEALLARARSIHAEVLDAVATEPPGRQRDDWLKAQAHIVRDLDIAGWLVPLPADWRGPGDGDQVTFDALIAGARAVPQPPAPADGQLHAVGPDDSDPWANDLTSPADSKEN